MVNQWDLRASNSYYLKSVGFAVAYWVAFNIFTGLISGNHSLNDNYFVLFVLFLIAIFKSVYRVTYSGGLISISRFGMIASNVDLSEATKVVVEDKKIVIYCSGDTRYHILIDRLPKSELDLVVSTLQHTKSSPSATFESPKETIQKENISGMVTYIITSGIAFFGYGGISLISDKFYLPKRRVIQASELGMDFYYYAGACLLIGVLFVLIGYFKYRSTRGNQIE